MINTVKCDQCGADIEISKAFVHQIEEQQAAVHKEELTQAKTEAGAIARQKALEEFQFQARDRDNENKELKESKTKLQNELLEMSKVLRQLKENLERQEVENEKKLNIERDKIKNEALKLVSEKTHGEMQELKKQLEDTKKSLDDANYKLTQKSQQLQGEVLELDLEKTLRSEFPDDDISPVAKGRPGGDIIQTVRGKSGKIAGSILWEVKRAQWQGSYLDKLKLDTRSVDASFGILVTTNLPKDIQKFQIMPGRLIVSSYDYADKLAPLIRRFIFDIANAKQTADQTDEKLQALYEFLQSESFRHRFEIFADGIVQMELELSSEIRSTERIWEKRRIQIKRLQSGASSLYGAMQSIVGHALPDIKALSVPDSSDDIQLPSLRPVTLLH